MQLKYPLLVNDNMFTFMKLCDYLEAIVDPIIGKITSEGNVFIIWSFSV